YAQNRLNLLKFIAFLFQMRFDPRPHLCYYLTCCNAALGTFWSFEQGFMSRKQQIQFGFLLLLFLSMSFSFPEEKEKWQGIHLPYTLLESRLNHCQTNDRGCLEALQYLEGQIQTKRNKIKTARDLHELLQNSRKESELVAGAFNAWLSTLDPHARLVTTESEE